MLHLLTPSQFARYSDKIFPLLVLATLLLTAAGLYMAFFTSPPDYQQGETIRIMYVHVPSAWMSLFIYTVMAFASLSFLIWRNPLSDMIAQSAAPIGAGFTFITLVTGSLWGKPIWGTWWVWDARLTSVLILFFFYLGYMGLANAFENKERGAKAAAILSLVGLLNIPIIKFSVDWWHTLHQPASVLKLSGPTIHSSMLYPLILMFLAFISYFLLILCIRIKSAILIRKTHRLQMHHAR